MSLATVSVWTAASILVKISSGLIIIKLLAVSFGPDGVGQAGNFSQLITILGVVTGAGIFNGVTKYVAQYQQQPNQLTAVIGTASAIVLIFSLLIALLFLFAAESISQILFGHTHYQGIIRIVAFFQFGIAWANLSLAIIRGFRDVVGNSLSLIVGSVIGVLGYVVCYYLGGYRGALVGLSVVPALIVVPAMWFLIRRYNFPLRVMLPRWNGSLARQLAKFAIMALVTSITVPISWMMIRDLLATYCSWREVGLWQGAIMISNAWMQIITSIFGVWLLPTLSRLNAKKGISEEIFRTLRLVLPLVTTVGFCVWLLRDVVIWLLFSSQFYDMRDLFIWKLIGDVLKVSTYVFGYLIIAKTSLFFYIAAELTQSVLLISFSHWLIPISSVVGAAQAYMASYIVYFPLCLCTFFIYHQK